MNMYGGALTCAKLFRPGLAKFSVLVWTGTVSLCLVNDNQTKLLAAHAQYSEWNEMNKKLSGSFVFVGMTAFKPILYNAPETNSL